MEIKSRRKFSKEFKQDVLNMLKTGNKSVPELCKEIGISESVIYRWYKKNNGKTEEGKKLSVQEKEIRELRAKLSDITEERDILKKAVSISARGRINSQKQGTLK